MKGIFTLVACLFVITAAAQNTSIIRGVVKTADGIPAGFVSVGLKGTSKGAVTNNYGQFEIKKVAPGKYVLKASFTGLQTQETMVTIAANEILTLPDIVLKENETQLKEVMINGVNNKRLVNKESGYIARMPLKNLENPQVYTVIGKEIIKQQVITNIADAFNAGSSAAPASYPSGGIAIVSRGFLTEINARNGLPTTSGRSQPDIVNVERIEILKGPSGTLFGGSVSSFGGVVNLVTKKPVEGFLGEVSYNVGSFGLNRVTADINTPFNKEETALFRINASLHRENSFRNAGHNNSFVIAPSFSYKVNDRLTFFADIEIQRADQTRMTYTQNPGLLFKHVKEIPLGYDQTLFGNDIDAQTFSSKYFAEARYKISDNWTAVTNASFVSENVLSSYQSYTRWLNNNEVVRSVGLWGPIYNNYTTVQQNFNGSFKTGVLKHKILMGLDYSNYITTREGWSTTVIDTVNILKDYKLLKKAKVDAAFVNGSKDYSWKGKTNNSSYGAYVSDVVSLGDRLYAMLSLRFDRFEQSDKAAAPSSYNQNSLTPKLGLVYQPVKEQVSLFANYMSGFQNIAPIEQPDGRLFVVSPIYAKQWEAGIKTDAFQHKLITTLSYYSIAIDNAIRTDGERFTFQDGKQNSKGIELEVAAQLLEGLNLLGAYGYNENKYIRATSNEGKIAANAPNNLVNYWISYQFNRTGLKGLGIGAGGNYVDKIFATADNTFYVPAYHVLNATLFYETTQWRLGIKLNNLSNEKYWDSYGYAQKPRNVVCNLTFKF
ncbi:TonB-dependent receptor [Chitinophaga defluvii]|uniref:TonB-dependent receptor n=1 Tax=Chitinophaga defluvii TaxID=3163343 RepID=A0ABV2TF44_9BACT